MKALAGHWNRFWFAPTATSTLAVVRVAYGSLLLAWSLSLAFDLAAFFSGRGLLPESPRAGWNWSLLALFPSDGAVTALYAVLVASAVCVAIGFRTRLATVVALVAMLSFQRRTPFLFNGGDMLLRIIGLYLVLAPAGAALSVDRWRRHRHRFWEFPSRAPWALRLIQLQLSVVYLFTVWEKLRGKTWNDGTAVSYALRVDELVRFPVPSWLSESLLAANVLTFGTLAVEVALAFLVWNRRARPWVLAAGVLLHASIEVTMGLGFFSATLLVAYLAFVPADVMTARVLAVRRRCSRDVAPAGSTVAALPPVSAAPGSAADAA